MKSFKQSVKEALKYYVYALVDPRDKRIFYVGKGIGDRVYQHAEASLDEMNESLKLSKSETYTMPDSMLNITFFATILQSRKHSLWSQWL